MTFRKSAALSLSALMLSGNLMLPLAEASPMMQGVTAGAASQLQANQRLSDMIQGPLDAVLHQQQVSHPMRHKAAQKQGILEWLNPLSHLMPGKQLQTAKTTPAKTITVHSAHPVVRVAMPLPLTNEPIQVQPVKKLKVISQQAKAGNAPVHTASHGKIAGIQPVIRVAQPLEPVADANAPMMSATPEVKQAPRIEPTDLVTAARKFTYTQIFLPVAQAVSDATKTIANADADTVYKSNPVFPKIYQTQDPQARKIAEAKVEKAAETFNMMATTALDKLVMQTKSSNMQYGPRLDSGDSDTYTSNNAVKVLKSGISQKMTSVDLTIGKAEVIYLSRPASRVSVSNPEVASAVVISPTQIQLIGKSVGVANLLVWGDMVSPDHTVVDINVHKDVSVLVSQLKYVDPGIQIVPMAAEDTVILTGQAENRETAQLAVEMAKAFFSGNNMAGAPNNSGPNSQAPGSAIPGQHTNVINLLKVKGEPSTKVELVRQRLHEVDPNIRLEVVPGPDGNEKVILTGRVPTASIASKALNLASVFYGQPGMKMVTAQGGNDYTRLQINNQSASSSGGSSQSSSQSGTQSSGANMLQGSVMTDATGNVISMLEIAQKPQIKCSIKFLELNKTSLNALGGSLSGMSGNTGLASWSGVQSPAPGKPISVLSTQNPSGSDFGATRSRSIGSGTAQNFVGSNFNQVYQNGITQVLTINNQLAAAIQALQERRQVRTLAEPTLTLLSGEQGSFLAGGEIPIAFVGGQGQVSIQYKEFGIRLNLLPNVTDDGKIQMQVAPEVSSLDQANGVSTNSVSVPAFITRRMNTTLLVEPGQSFVLAGLYNQQDTDSMSRFPGLGSLPILGSFFRNTWDTRSKSEMVVVIRPEIIYSNTGSSDTHTSALPSTPQTTPPTTEVSKK